MAFARAVESLHAADFGGSAAAVDERDERVRRALAALPEDLVDWARPLLVASTPPVQRHRIVEMVTEVGAVGRRLVGERPEDFAAWVVGTRNHLVHPTGRAGKRVLPEDEDLYWFSVSLHWLGSPISCTGWVCPTTNSRVECSTSEVPPTPPTTLRRS